MNKKFLNQKTILIVVVSILALIILGMLIIKPAVLNHNDKLRTQGIEFAVVSIMQQVATCQIVPLTYFNQTINIIAVDCLVQEKEKETEEIE